MESKREEGKKEEEKTRRKKWKVNEKKKMK